MTEKRNGLLTKISYRLKLPPSQTPDYMKHYKRIERRAQKLMELHGNNWSQAIEPWLKRNGYIGILTILAFDLVWLMQNLVNK